MAKLDRDNAFFDYKGPTQTIVDEQTKAAGMRAAQSDSAAAAKTIAKTSDELLLDRVNAQIDKTKSRIAELEASAPKEETAEERLKRIAAARILTQSGNNPDNPKPTEDPGEGMYWANFGGVWRKYKVANTNTDADTIVSSIDNGDGTVTTTWKSGRKETVVAYQVGNGKGNGNGTLDSNGNPIVTNTTGAPTTNIDVLKAALRGLGFTSAIIDQSTSFLNGLIRDGLDIDNATEVFLNSKEYTLKNGTKMTSPFYTEYGYLNDGLTIPKSASDLFNSVEGYKGVVDKYKLSTKYLSQDNLKLYVKNDVTVADLSERAATAQLRALEADPFQIKALMVQGYIASAADLTDFYLDAKIGKEQLELNRQTGVFTAEALRRAKSGISASATQLAGFKQLTATLAAKGYNEAQISQLAGTGFENISETLMPTTQLAQIYEKAGGTVESNTSLTEDIQTSLLAEEFTGTASQRRKKLFEQNVRSFQGQSGTTTGSLRTTSASGML
jgi:hypothetical protein